MSAKIVDYFIMEKFKILKRKSPRFGWLFYAQIDRAYKSPYFNSPEKRDKAIEKYIEKQLEIEKERQERAQKTKEWLNNE